MVGLVRGGIKIITILNRGQLHNNNIIVIYNDGYQGIWEYKKMQMKELNLVDMLPGHMLEVMPHLGMGHAAVVQGQ